MPDELLAGVQEEGAIPDLQGQSESPDAPTASAEQDAPQGEKEEQAPTTSGANGTPTENVPFHKHPRWKRMLEENKALQKRLEDLASKQSQPASSPDEIPPWFKESMGDQAPEAWKQYKPFYERQKDELLKEVELRQRQKAEAERSEAERWEKWRDDSLMTIEDETGVDFSTEHGKNLKNEFFAFVKRVKPTDDQGNIDLVNGFRLFQEFVKKPDEGKIQAKKQLAAQVTSDTKAETPSKDFQTQKDLRNKSFRDLIKF